MRIALAATVAATLPAVARPAFAQVTWFLTPLQQPPADPPRRPLSPLGPGGSQSLGPGGGQSLGPGGGQSLGPSGLSGQPLPRGGPCGLAPLPPCIPPSR
ncbi:hypothetical protein M0638_05060 [Roseomonas sp. NAR14]|uniref:Uncharacterized protein n=1 Tax=Roseomonas acroporae TaxID=2937791 RepID=A0A9X1Y7Y5_9PROT|nr:hypothetical protein [Roseomonas acroporae]MCK8783752.1 hypothetical protein [Roseomonas acroporae]